MRSGFVIGFIGFGEAGLEMAKGLISEGMEGIRAYDPILQSDGENNVLKDVMSSHGIVPCFHAEDVMKSVSIILSAVPAQFALAACESVQDKLNQAHLFVDVSASPPKVKQQIAEKVGNAGGLFVDAAMLGPLTVNQHKVPMLISGSGAEKFESLMKPYGMNISVISEQAGDASSIKLMRSIFMKGTATLLVEVLEASRRLKVEDKVLQSIQKTIEDVPFEKLVNQLVTGTSIHSKRRSVELEGSLEILDQLNLNNEMTKASKNKLEYLTMLNIKEYFASKRPKTWQELLNESNQNLLI